MKVRKGSLTYKILRKLYWLRRHPDGGWMSAARVCEGFSSNETVYSTISYLRRNDLVETGFKMVKGRKRAKYRITKEGIRTMGVMGGNGDGEEEIPVQTIV